MQWIDGEIKAVKGLARRVSKLASAMKAESWGVSECVLDRARGGERVVLRQGGRAVAALVPIADLKLLQKLEDEKDLRDIRAASIEMKRKGDDPWGEGQGGARAPMAPGDATGCRNQTFTAKPPPGPTVTITASTEDEMSQAKPASTNQQTQDHESPT